MGKKGIETIVYELANMDFGKVSRFFTSILGSKAPVRNTLREKSKSKIHPYFKEMCVALLAKNKTAEKLSDLIDQTLHDKKIEIRRLVKSIDITSTWLVIS
jgi:hypothetical protein